MITTQEETTMLGAMNFDYSLITGKTLISLDGIKEAYIEASSAGMCSITLSKKIKYCNQEGNTYKLSVNGLMGGHSGDDMSLDTINNKIKSIDFKLGKDDKNFKYEIKSKNINTIIEKSNDVTNYNNLNVADMMIERN